jgi:hypothetical protein
MIRFLKHMLEFFGVIFLRFRPVPRAIKSKVSV